MDSEVGVEEELSAVVLRCTCRVKGQHPGAVCPNARAEEQGVISYRHTNPLKERVGRLARGLQPRKDKQQ